VLDEDGSSEFRFILPKRIIPIINNNCKLFIEIPSSEFSYRHTT